jgi:hypothetical protein
MFWNIATTKNANIRIITACVFLFFIKIVRCSVAPLTSWVSYLIKFKLELLEISANCDEKAISNTSSLT